MKKYQTNVEFITELMEFSNYGSLASVFVMQALDQFSRAVLEAPDEIFSDSAHFVVTETWKGVAKEIADKINQRKIQS